MSRLASRAPRPSTVTAGILLAGLAACSFASAGYVASQLVSGGVSGMTVAFYESLFGLALLFAVNMRALSRGAQPPQNGILWGLAAGVAYAFAIGAFYTSLERIPFSVAAPITGAVPLASYAFVLLLLRGTERITRRAALGAALVVAGVAMVGVSA